MPFNTQYKLAGTLASSKLFDEETKPDLLKDAIVGAVKENSFDCGFISPRFQKRPITTAIMLANTNNLNTKADSYFKYGRDRHPDYLPRIVGGTTAVSEALNPELYGQQVERLKEYLEEELGYEVEIMSYTYNRILNKTAYNMELQRQAALGNVIVHNRDNDAGFNGQYFSFTHEGGNIVENWQFGFVQTPGGAGYDVVPQFESPGWTYQLFNDVSKSNGANIKYGPNEPLVDKDHVAIGLYDEVRNRISSSYKLVIDRSYYDGRSTDFFHQAVYKKATTGEYFQFEYHQAENLYPDIHLDDAVAENDQAYPRIYIADNKRFTAYEDLGEDYKFHTEKLALNIGIDIQTIQDAIIPEGREDSNYDVVEDSYIEFSADLNSQSHDELAYVYQYFRLAYLEGTTILGRGMLTGTRRTDVATNWNRIQMFLRTGDVDTYNTIPTLEGSHTVVNHDAAFNGRLIRDPNNPTKPIGRIKTQFVLNSATQEDGVTKYNSSIYVIRRQINETQFVELAVEGFHRTDTFKKPREFDLLIDIVWNDIGTLDSGCCVVPITRLILNSFNNLQASGILYDSCRLFVRSQQEIVTKWYERSELWGLVRVVLFIYSFGTSEAWADGFIAVVQQLITDIAINRLVLELFVLLIKVLGVEIGFLVAALAAIYSFTQGEKDLLFDLLDAEDMFKAATFMIEVTNRVIVEEFEELQEDYEAYIESRQEQLEELEKFERELGISQREGFEMWMATRMTHVIDTNESPDEFYNRTVHNTNPGVSSLDGVDTYVCNNIKLPKVKNEAMKMETENVEQY